MFGSMARRHGRVRLVKVNSTPQNQKMLSFEGEQEIRRPKQEGVVVPAEWCKSRALTGNATESASLAERFRNGDPEAPCSLSFLVIRCTAKPVVVNNLLGVLHSVFTSGRTPS